MPEHHTILGGKVHLYKRPNSSLWQCSSYFVGKNRRTSTKEESLSKAKEIAEDWYLQLRGKLRDGEIKSEKTFREVSEHYLREFDIMTQGQRNKRYVEGQHWRSEVRLIPFFGGLSISEITSGKIQEYRLHRHQEALKRYGSPFEHLWYRLPHLRSTRIEKDQPAFTPSAMIHVGPDLSRTRNVVFS